MVRAGRELALPFGSITSYQLLTMIAIAGPRKRGRPPTGWTQVGVKMAPDDLELLDAWIAANGEMSRPEALRKILRLVATKMPS